MDANSKTEKALVMNRREALKRTGLLFGATVLSASAISEAIHAQSQAAVPGSSLKNFTAAEADTLRAVVDRILPKTDTPGALDVGVPEYIDVMYGVYMTPEEKEQFKHGVVQTNGDSRVAHGNRFADLDGNQQDAVLKELAESNPSHLLQFRQLALTGYFTSETVMKNVLNYDFIPGMWKGCVDVSEVGNKVWAE